MAAMGGRLFALYGHEENLQNLLLQDCWPEFGIISLFALYRYEEILKKSSLKPLV